MFFQWILFSTISFTNAYEMDACLQLDCDDAVELSDQAEANLVRVTEALQRMRELAIQSSNGAIGNKERGFLDDEYQAHRDEISRILQHASFVDIFQTQHFYFRDGLEFRTPIKIDGGSFAYLQDFHFEALSTKSLGAYAGMTMALQAESSVNSIQPVQPYFLFEINEIGIHSDPNDDVVSLQPKHVLSSISVAHAINRMSLQTGVEARTLPTVVALKDMNAGIKAIEVLKAGDLSLNGISILGFTKSLNQLVDSINDFVFSTGVYARVHRDGYIELIATDARNVDLEMSERVMEAFGFQSPEKTFNGSVELSSREDFSIRWLDGFPVMQEFEKNMDIQIPVDHASNLSNTRINSQLGAQSSLRHLDKSLHQVNWQRVKASKPRKLCR